MSNTLQHKDKIKVFGLIRLWAGSFWFWAILTTGIVLWVYAPVRRFDVPVWDDRVHITDNPLVVVGFEALKEPRYWTHLFTQTINGTFIPLTVLSWAIENAVFGSNALVVSHIVNVVLHLIVCLLAGRLLLVLGAGAVEAGTAMLLFGLHPMHVESVAWATQRKDVLYAVFYLLSVLLFVRYLMDRRTKDLVTAVGTGILSMLAKPMALSLPFVWMLAAWFMRKSFDKRAVTALWGLGFFVAGLGWLTYQHFMRRPQWDSWAAVADSVWVWVWCFAFYWRSFFWPVGLSPHYEIPQPVHWANPSYLSAIGLVAAVIGYAFLSRDRVFRFAVLWFVCSVFFLLRWDIGYDITPVADRFMYLASLPLCWWIGRTVYGLIHCGGRFWKDIPMAAGVCYIWAVLFLAVTAHSVVSHWADEERLWSYAVFRNPQDAYAHFSLGQVLMQQGRVDQAMDHYQTAARLRPHWARPLNNLADILLRQGKTDEALRLLQQAVQRDPVYTPARINLAEALFKTGRLTEALDIIEEGLKRNGKEGLLWLLRGDVVLSWGRFDEADACYRRAQALLGDEPRILNRLGALAMRQGRPQQAMVLFEQVLSLDPMNRAARHNLDLLRRLKTFTEDSKERNKALIQLAPSGDEGSLESPSQGQQVDEIQNEKSKDLSAHEQIDIEKATSSQGGAFFLPPVRGKRSR